MQIKHLDSGVKGSFYIEENGQLLAELAYTLTGDDRISFDHTNVTDSARGHGLGNELVDAAVSYSRDNGLKVIPLCPFARSVFLKTPGYSDVLIK